MTDQISVAAIIVTYNRKDLLTICLNSLLQQTVLPAVIVVVDNGSTDRTSELFAENGEFFNSGIKYIPMRENLGGAGGFCRGLDYIMEHDIDWFWLMDDDACPGYSALEILRTNLINSNNIYASCAVSNNENSDLLCWPVTKSPRIERIQCFRRSDLLPVHQAIIVPFLGFCIHRNLVKKIGKPRDDFFLAGDDAEYCHRATTSGSDIYVVRDSLIFHPYPNRRIYHFIFFQLSLLDLPPWKRYYDVRNKILIGRIYYGPRFLLKTLPGIFLRWLITIITLDRSYKQSKAFLLGVKDGLFNRTGIRWKPGD